MVKKDKKDGKHLFKTDPNLDWTLSDLLGKGSFGSVFVATNKEGQTYAAKICEIKCDGDLEDMKLEAHILTTCEHANILKAKCAYYFKNNIWMLLELCKGGSLDDVADKVDGFDEDTTKQITYQVTTGLEYLHQKGIMHRDIKAGNVMLTEDGICKLADFGVAAWMNEPNGRRNTFIGTPYWMAPEVIQTETFPNKTYSSKADVYSLGIFVIEVVEMIPPGCSYLPSQILLVRVRSDSPTLKEPEKWSKEMNNFVEKTLYKSEDKRLTAEECLRHPFLNNDVAKKINLCIELFKMATSEETQEVVEDYPEDYVSTDNIDIEYGEESNSPTITTPRTEASPSVSKSKADAKRAEFANKIATKTIKKTIKYELNGKQVSKTIYKVVDEDNKNLREHEKSLREEITKEFRLLKLERQRECKRMLESQEISVKELKFKQKNEYEVLINKYNAESDYFTKNLTKELDKKNAVFRSAQEKYFNKLKLAFDKERKNYNSAVNKHIRPSSVKFDVRFENPNFLRDLAQSHFKQWKNFISGQRNELIELAIKIVEDTHQSLISSLTTIAVTKLTHSMEEAELYKINACSMLDFTLQQKKKADANEQAIFIKNMATKRETIVKQQAVVVRELPKTQRTYLKHFIDMNKKALRKKKVKNEKEVLKKLEEKKFAELQREKEALKEVHAKQLSDFDALRDKQYREMIEYQEEGDLSSHKYYQELIHEESLRGENLLKEAIIYLSDLINKRDKDYENDSASASQAELELFQPITSESF